MLLLIWFNSIKRVYNSSLISLFHFVTFAVWLFRTIQKSLKSKPSVRCSGISEAILTSPNLSNSVEIWRKQHRLKFAYAVEFQYWIFTPLILTDWVITSFSRSASNEVVFHWMLEIAALFLIVLRSTKLLSFIEGSFYILAFMSANRAIESFIHWISTR